MVYNIILTCAKYEIQKFITNRNDAIKEYKDYINSSENNPYKPVWIELQFLTNNDFKTALTAEVK